MSRNTDQQSITSGDPHTNPNMMSDLSKGQHHVYSSLSYEEALHPKTFRFTEKLRHPFQYLRQVIQDSTAPPIPIEDIQYNEMIHQRIEQTDVYRQQHEYERQHRDYQQNLVSLIRDKTVNQLQETAKSDLGAVVQGAGNVLEKAKDVISDTVSNVIPSTPDQQDTSRTQQRGVQERAQRMGEQQRGRDQARITRQTIKGTGDQDQSAISAALETTQDVARKALEKGEELYQRGKEQVQPVLETVQDKAQPYVDKAKQEIKSLATDAADYLRSDNQQQQDQQSSYLQSAKDTIQDVYEHPQENLIQAKDYLVEKGSQLKDQVQQIDYQNVKDQVVDKAQQAKDAILGSDQQQYRGRQQDLTQQAKDKAQDLGRQARDYVEDKGQQLKDQYQRMDTDQLRDKAQDLGRQAKDYAQEKGQQLKDQYQRTDMQQVQDKAQDLGRQAKDYIQDKGQQVQDQYRNLDYEQVKDKAQDLGRQAKDYAQEKGQQLKDQYQNLDTQQLKEKVKDTGRDLKDQFAQIGKQTGEQLQLTGNPYIDRAKREVWEQKYGKIQDRDRDQDRERERDQDRNRDYTRDREIEQRQRSQDRDRDQQQKRTGQQSYFDQDKQQIESSGGRTAQDKWNQGQGIYQQDRNVKSVNEYGSGSGQNVQYNQFQQRSDREKDRERGGTEQRVTQRTGFQDQDIMRERDRQQDRVSQYQWGQNQRQDRDRDEEYDQYMKQQKYEQRDRDIAQRDQQDIKDRERQLRRDQRGYTQIDRENFRDEDRQRYLEGGRRDQQQQQQRTSDRGGRQGQDEEGAWEHVKDKAEHFYEVAKEKVSHGAEQVLGFVHDSFIASDDNDKNVKDYGYDVNESERRRQEDIQRNYHRGEPYTVSDKVRDAQRYAYDKKMQAQYQGARETIDKIRYQGRDDQDRENRNWDREREEGRDLLEKAKDKASDLYEQAKDTATDMYDRARDTLKDARHATSQQEQDYDRLQRKTTEQQANITGVITKLKDSIADEYDEFRETHNIGRGDSDREYHLQRRHDQRQNQQRDKDQERRSGDRDFERRFGDRDQDRRSGDRDQERRSGDRDQYQQNTQRWESNQKDSDRSSGNQDQDFDRRRQQERINRDRDDYDTEDRNREAKFWKGDERNKPELERDQERRKDNRDYPVIPAEQTQGRQGRYVPPYDEQMKQYNQNIKPSDIYNFTPQEQQQYGVLRQQFETINDKAINERDIVGKTVNMNRDSLRGNVRQEVKMPSHIRGSMANQQYASPYPEPGYIKREAADR